MEKQGREHCYRHIDKEIMIVAKIWKSREENIVIRQGNHYCSKNTKNQGREHCY